MMCKNVRYVKIMILRVVGLYKERLMKLKTSNPDIT